MYILAHTYGSNIDNFNIFISIFWFLLITLDNVEPSNFKNVVEGNPVRIQCGKKEIFKASKVTWSNQNHTDLRLVSRFMIDNNGSLRIGKTKKQDRGYYTCSRTRKLDREDITSSVSIYLNVEYTPYIVYIKKIVTVYKGEKAELPCKAVGHPGVTMRWLMPNGARIKSDEKFTTASNGSLLIKDVQMGDVRNYTCDTQNDIGPGEKRYTTLSILIQPMFLTNQPNTKFELNAGDKVTLDCSVSGIPKPTIKWKKLSKNREKEEPLNKAVIYKSAGLLLLNKVKVSDIGIYLCEVQSPAGSLNRSFSIEKVFGPPDPPVAFAVDVSNSIAYVSWKSSYNGGSKQTFEVWYRVMSSSDYEWNQKSTNLTSLTILLSGPDVDSSGNSISYYFSIKSKNKEGSSNFVNILEVERKKYGSSNGLQMLQPISTTPLEPKDFSLNMTKEGYQLNWVVINVPGRPKTSKVIVTYREMNSSNTWNEYTVERRKRAIDSQQGIYISVTDISNEKHPLEFQIYSVSPNGAKSSPKSPDPTLVVITGMPGQKVSENQNQKNKTDIVPPIVLGIIFGIFIIILVISLYCFCRKKKGTYKARKNQDKTIEFSKEIEIHSENTSQNGNKKTIKADLNSPRRFHFLNCPALKLGSFTNSNKMEDEINCDDVHALIEPHEREESICTCKNRYLTLNPEDVRMMKKEKKLFKSSSTPNFLATIEKEKDLSTIDPNELLDEEEYDISDCENGNIADLKKISTLKRSIFKDSYDQFCKQNHLTGTNEKSELDKNIVDGHDDISENSVPESERLILPSRSNDYCDVSNSISDSELAQDKLYVSKPSSNLKYIDNYLKNEMGYASDVSTRSSPLDPHNIPKHKYQKPPKRISPTKNYYSDDDFERPHAPPSYKQAINDIERMSEINEITDSEDMYDHLMEMEKKLGIELGDSLENDLNDKGLSSIPSSYSSFRSNKGHNTIESGYMSDIGFTRDRYSDREKSERCAKLLSEFKSSRCSKNIEDYNNESELLLQPSMQGKSIMGNIIDDKTGPPILKRSNSAGSGSVYNEWLV